MPRIILILSFFTLFSCTSKGNEETLIEKEVRRRSETYFSVLNKKEIALLLDLWAEEGEYRNPLTGKLVRGKSNIKKEYLNLFNQTKESQVAINIHQISFPFKDKAIVDGALTLDAQEKGQITILFVKQTGVWKILNLSEINLFD